ncbi:MAG TPA: type II secretion system F family protein [Candidatus Didemnitutus sp.]|nr:type II secretion system F family protein [Candidatus Didemnitutus sp.]
MPQFTYSARAGAGPAPVTGTLDAPTRRDAVRQLIARGLQPTALNEVGVAPVVKAKRTAVAGVKFSRRLRLPFLEALAELAEGGLSAGESVRMLAARLQDPSLRALCANLWGRLGEGYTLSRAMATQSEVFDLQTINLISASEATGNLHEVLQRLIQHFHEQRELRRQLLAAMLYPIFITFLAFVVMLIFLFVLLPKLQGLLSSLGGKLPLPTRLMVAASNFALHFGPFVLVALVIAAVVVWRWRTTVAGKRAIDALLLKLPVTRDIALRTAILNFTHTLAVLLENGVTTAEALRLTERAIDNETVRTSLRECTDRVLEGSALSTSLARTGFFPPLLTDRLAVGEQTGHLAPGLRSIARNYQVELSRRLQALTKIISGVVLGSAFGFVAFLAYAIVSAMLAVSGSFRI